MSVQVIAISDRTLIATQETITVLVLQKPSGEVFDLPLRTTDREFEGLLGFLFVESEAVVPMEEDDRVLRTEPRTVQQMQPVYKEPPQDADSFYGYDETYEQSFNKASPKPDETYEDFEGGGGIDQL